MLERISSANLTTGYTLVRTEDKPFGYYIEANVHAPDVFGIFRDLAFVLMPDAAAPLVGIKEDEPVFGPYTDRALAVAVFEPYADFLANDGFIEFGIIHQSKQAFEEIFIASPKYFKIWTNNPSGAEGVLQRAGIPRSEDLAFIDEYPMVSLSVDGKEQAAWAGPYSALQKEFDRLPPPVTT